MRSPVMGLIKFSAVCLMVLSLQVSAVAAGFLIPPTFAVGPEPSSIVVADFNGDGNLDLAAIQLNDNVFPGNLTILLANANGTFQNPVYYNLGSFPGEALVAADFNHDGILDLAAAVGSSAIDNVSVLLGHGDGTFGNAMVYNSGGDLPEFMAVGDFNGDGNPDLILSQRIDNFASVLLNDGTGKFNQLIEVPLGGLSGGPVVVGDFNHDGKLDAALLNLGQVAVLLGNGDGSFRPVTYYDGSDFPGSLAMADVNRDGNLDLVAGTGLGVVDVLLGVGDGTFALSPLKSSIPLLVSLVSLPDVNGDGSPDLVFASATGDSVGVLLGNGDGTFQSPVFYNVSAPTGLATVDLNKDGHQDLLVSEATDGLVGLLKGRGDGTFSAPILQPITVFNDLSGEVAIGDFNADGKTDVATVSVAFSADVYIFLGNGDGTLRTPTILVPASFGNSSIAAGDLNGDGKLDLVVGQDKGVLSVSFGNGDGTFQSPVALQAAEQPLSLALADLNGDGHLDIVAACFDALANRGDISVLLNNGSGGFLPATNYPTSRQPQGVTVGDINQDGILDLATINLAGNYDTMLGNGDGTFQPAVINDLPFAIPVQAQIQIADVNHDGHPDILAAMGRNGLAIAFGVGDGTFKPAKTSNNLSIDLALADFNADGNLDIASTQGGFLEALGVANGTFLPSTNYGTGATHLAVGNFNGDNATDVVVSVRGGLSVFLNTGGTIEKLTSSLNPSKLNQPVTFTATLKASVKGSPGGTPTGNVTFMDGSVMLGKVALAGGKASFVTSTLSVGTHKITALNSGDTNFNGNSAKLKQVVSTH